MTIDYFTKTVRELKILCKEINIIGYSKKNREELIEVIDKYEYELEIVNKTCEINYFTKTVRELKILCKERNIKGYSKKNKQTIIELLDKTGSSLQLNTISTIKIMKDNYTVKLLIEQYNFHKLYINFRISTTKNIGVNVRLPSIPEDISENIVKQIIHNKLNDKTSTWNCKSGDLYSITEGKQECKCFTSDGPCSFTPSSDWDIIYFLDARKWLNDYFILYRISLKKSSDEWKNIRVNKTQTFEDQSNQGRRPRINWEYLYPQIEKYCTKVYEGIFNDIFIPVEEAKE